ncbi:MAG: prepilin-type N-terminal cleavage/methylation domain-containing protein [Phycisphaerales bacterium]|nr:MAG: prepilin-type N-terminal cleavage/methylation domain-containing protein [Phycisphaerales bacterium]
MRAEDQGNRRLTDGGRVAFTLIELLVVIAIIALLIAILLPSLEAARRQSKQSGCLSHIKNIATSSRVYEADDPNGWGIPVHPLQYRQCPDQWEGEVCSDPVFVGAYEWGGKSGIGRDSFVTGTPGDPINSKYGTLAGFGPAGRPMNDILYPGGFKDNTRPIFDRFGATLDTQLELDLFRCPADDGPPRGAHCPDWVKHSERSSYDHFGNSYAANLFMIWAMGGRLGPEFEVSEMGSNSPYLRPTSRIPTPSRTLYYEENIGRWAWACRRERCDGSLNGLDISPGVDPGPTKTLRGWHGRDWTYNRAFVDAHAEPQKIYIEGTEDEEGYALHYRVETVFPDSPGRQTMAACVIIRGDGWQKDTLPAEFLRTGLLRPGGGRASYEDCVENP